MLSFTSMFGGVCTLLETSTNILVSSIAADNGLAPFRMFEFTPFGLVIVAAGFIYLYLGLKLVPPRRENTDLERDFNTADYISDIRVTGEYEHLGKPLQDIEDIWRLDIDVVFLFRDGDSVSDKESTELQKGDVLRIRGTAEEIDKLIQRRPGLEIRPTRKWEDVKVGKSGYELLETIVAPDSDHRCRKVKDIDCDGDYGAAVLGVYRRGRPAQEALRDIRLQGGSCLLLAMRKKRLSDRCSGRFRQLQIRTYSFFT